MKHLYLLIIIALGSSSFAQDLDEPQFDVDSITLDNWMYVPHVKGRLATENDVKENRAIFKRTGKGHSPIDMDIPSLAYLVDARTEEKYTVVIIQAEKTDSTNFTGYRVLNGGGYGICLLEDLELIENITIEKKE